MKLPNIYLLLLVFSLSFVSCETAQEKALKKTNSLHEKLSVLFPEAEIDTVKNIDGFKQTLRVVLNEPLDHKHPEKGTFDHYMYVSHMGYDKPTVIEIEGYQTYYKRKEMSEVLQGNQIIVEYRFYGKSKPDTIPWEYLTNDQAIEDYHHIVKKMKAIYKGKWVSSGISKGGETVLIYKSKYPSDVDVAVPYVAPLINTPEDPRTEDHIKTVGSEECRQKIVEFQRLALKNRVALLEEINKYASNVKMSFNEVPVEEALEYAVLEFPFSFWQWGGKCKKIPSEKSTAKEQFDYLNKIVGIGFYCDATYESLLPSFYQHMVELGYYGFDTTPVKDLLKVVRKPTNRRFAPKGVEMKYNPSYIKAVRNYVENRGGRILYIYGGYDTWGACAPSPAGHVDALKMVLEGGSHATRIKHFSKEDQDRVYNKLQEWLGNDVKLYPLE